MDHPYRVFVSYSRRDKVMAARVRARLEEIGARPMSDIDIPPGTPFPEEIKSKIAYAHVLIPVLTPKSSKRAWVHQEVGFAMGLGVPILPLALGQLPEGMTEQLEAVIVHPKLRDLAARLTERTLDVVVQRAQQKGAAAYECAATLRSRTEMLVANARAVLRIGGPQRVRQRMAFGSFSLPDKSAHHPEWDHRDGPDPRPTEIRELLRQERKIMQEHAARAGCDLIIDPYVVPHHNTPGAAARLKTMLEFLAAMPDDKVRVAVNHGKIDGSLFIIGDWFVSEAVVPLYGTDYSLTMFTRHAPTVLHRLQEFDAELQDFLLPGPSSREAAMKLIRGLIKKQGRGGRR